MGVWVLSLYQSVFPATTQLGVWLFRDLHGVSDAVSDLTRTALLIMCTYPLFDAVVSYIILSLTKHLFCGGIDTYVSHGTMEGYCSKYMPVF